MGLPDIQINFKTKGTSLIERSAKGIVALILKDDTNQDFETREYKSIDQIIESDWTPENIDYIENTFMGIPNKVIVERIAVADTDYSNGLLRLKNKKWNYLAIPEIKDAEVQEIVTWIKNEREVNKKTFKAVLPNAEADNEGIINFCASNIYVGATDTTYTASQYTGRIAGILAGLPFTRSATYYELSEVDKIDESSDPNAEIDSGKLILINDGTKIKIGRGVNSLTTLAGSKGEEFKKIKIVDAVDLVKDDIRDTFDGSYVGKITNTYDHKILFLSAVNAYFEALEKLEVLDEAFDNKAVIDVQAQKTYLMACGVDVDALKEQEIKEYNTGSKVFASAKVKFLDAMEDLTMEIFM
ncbi:phage tail sheath C-terminal domain-containing protein [Abyssisolibacter fermentans]|uniref:phage tail sheath C-terminal domain-containing protein n=1 Tax=Abyssisolibacter fermentans TaxID=1766203 RepID=UPI0008330E13|nr:phage tail sheath C-terminal domain-containing protein [Abyssisolibacter fermentans]